LGLYGLLLINCPLETQEYPRKIKKENFKIHSRSKYLILIFIGKNPMSFSPSKGHCLYFTLIWVHSPNKVPRVDDGKPNEV